MGPEDRNFDINCPTNVLIATTVRDNPDIGSKAIPIGSASIGDKPKV